MRARAHSAQLNCFEAFAPFAAGVILAHSMGVDESLLARLSLLFVVFRALYSAAYLLDKAGIRSLLWFAAVCVNIALFILAATQ